MLINSNLSKIEQKITKTKRFRKLLLMSLMKSTKRFNPRSSKEVPTLDVNMKVLQRDLVPVIGSQMNVSNNQNTIYIISYFEFEHVYPWRTEC